MIKRLLLIFLPLLLIGCADKSDSLKPYRGMSAQQIFNQGELNLAKNNYTEAGKNFAAMNALYPYSAYSQQALLDSIYSYYKDDNSEMALASAGIYLRRYPRSEYADYAYYMSGLISFEMSGNWLQRAFHYDRSNLDPAYFQQAYTDFSRVVQWFPKSAYAKDSAIHMAFIRNMLARHDLDVANFYYERGAYVAAANRASLVVKHFPKSSQAKAALQMMTKSYKKLGLNQQANQTYQVLVTNYPQAANSI